MSERYILGPWDFNAELGTLSRDGAVKRLENRATHLLTLLCRASDRLVTYDEIITDIWKGRIVSQNSIAVVIADIRRALGDPARNPDYIETIPKRGYRLLIPANRVAETLEAPATTIESNASRRRLWTFMVAILLSVIAVTWVTFNLRQAGTSDTLVSISVSVSPIENQSGDPGLDPLTAAVSDLLMVQIMERESVSIGKPGMTDYNLAGRLTLWSGQPAVYLSATDATGVVIWSGMASGPENRIPGKMRKQIQLFIAETTSPE